MRFCSALRTTSCSSPFLWDRDGHMVEPIKLLNVLMFTEYDCILHEHDIFLQNHTLLVQNEEMSLTVSLFSSNSCGTLLKYLKQKLKL